MLDDPLLRFLAEGHRLRFVPFGGSGGDRLLQFCEKRLVEESASVGVPWCHGETGPEPFGFLCFHGGGMIGYYEDWPLLEAIGPGPETLVFFPRACCWRDDETFGKYVEALKGLDRRLLIFARDPVSHEHFKRLRGEVYADLRLSHDCAVLYSTVFEHDKDMLLTTLREPRQDLVAVYRRTDVESAGWPAFGLVGETCLHFDPAMVGFLSPEHTLTEIGQSAYLAYWNLCYMPRFVVTDRLHVALARWLFGLPTVLCPGVEHKIKAAWEHSLEADPRGLVFVESVDALRSAVEEHGLKLEVRDG